jgi:tetratricopeptide (TPR) repeat protein
MRERFGATVEALRTSLLREGLRFANVIAELPAPEHCLDQPDDRDWGYGGLLELRDIDIEVEALVELGDLDVARARQVAYMDLAVDLRSEYGIARAMFFRAEIHRLEGSLDEATADFGRVYERAWELRVAELAAEVQIKLTAIAGARGDWGAVDAHAFDAEAILLEFRPERVAKLWQVQGLALVTGPEQARARGLVLLQRAVEMREEQLREYGGTRQLLSEAHESYGRGLLAVGRAVEAVEYLDLALRVHEQEFGHGGWRTRGISMAKFTALIELRRFEDAWPATRTILKLDADAGNWQRYTEDAWWLARGYENAGEPHGAANVLRYGRDMALQHGSETDANLFDVAIERLTRQ